MLKILKTIELFCWFLPPLKQFKGGYFVYFLVLALSSILASGGYYLFKILPSAFHVISASVMIIYFQTRINKIKTVLMFLLIPVYFSLILNSFNFDLNSIIGLHLIIICQIIYLLLKYLYKTDSLNLYFIMLIVYETSIILKLVAVRSTVMSSNFYFYISIIFEIAICFYFILFNRANSYKYKIRTRPQ